MAVRAAVWFGAYVAVVAVPWIFAVIGVVDEEHGWTQRTAIAVAALVVLCCVIFSLVQNYVW